MVKRSRGMKSKTRYKLKKRIRQKGMPSVRKLLQPYHIGDNVSIKIDPSIHRGMPHPKFQGKIGIISEKRGKAYLIDIKERKKQKQLIARPEHIIKRD